MEKILYILLENKYLTLTNKEKDTVENTSIYAGKNRDIFIEYTKKTL